MAGARCFRVAVLDDYQRVANRFADWDGLGDGVEVSVFHDHVDDLGQLVNRLTHYDAIVAMRERTPLGRATLERLPALRLIVTAGGQNAAIDVAAATERGIVVCGTEGIAGGPSTTELTWGLVLAVMRSIPQEDAAIRAGRWQRGLGRGLRGRTLGIVGLGNLGKAMVPVAQAFGMKVVAWSRNLTDERAAAVGVERRDREEFFSSADVVTIHLKLSARSVGYVGREELRLMQPSACLVNTSRGPVVDEAALVTALREHWIAGAALDVFGTEPLPHDHPLCQLPNVVLSPHMGFVTEEAYREYFSCFVEDVQAFLAGAPIRVIRP